MKEINQSAEEKIRLDIKRGIVKHLYKEKLITESCFTRLTEMYLSC